MWNLSLRLWCIGASVLKMFSSSFFVFFFFFSSCCLFFLFLGVFFFVCLVSFLLPLPGVLPFLVLGLVGPTWPLLVLVIVLVLVVLVVVVVLVIVLVLVLSSIVWGRWWWWWWWPWWRLRRRQWWWWSAFAPLWCEVSICSLAWWWLAFVRLWFWRGWLVVAFARVWSPCVCSLGRWLASVCLGLVAGAGFAVACHGYALSGLGSCLWHTLSLSFWVCQSICFFGGIHGCLPAKTRWVEEVRYIVTPVVSLQSEVCGYSGSCWCWHPSSEWCSATIALGCWRAPVCRHYLGK